MLNEFDEIEWKKDGNSNNITDVWFIVDKIKTKITTKYKQIDIYFDSSRIFVVFIKRIIEKMLLSLSNSYRCLEIDPHFVCIERVFIIIKFGRISDKAAEVNEKCIRYHFHLYTYIVL